MFVLVRFLSLWGKKLYYNQHIIKIYLWLSFWRFQATVAWSLCFDFTGSPNIMAGSRRQNSWQSKSKPRKGLGHNTVDRRIFSDLTPAHYSPFP